MLLALDLATTTGWAVGDGHDDPELGHVTMPSTGEEVGPFADFFERWLNMMIDEWSPTRIIMEAPYLPRAKIDEDGKLKQPETTMMTTRKLQGLTVLTEMTAYRRGKIPITESAAITVKKTSTGYGGASKEDMVLIAKRLGYANATYDESDALGVWLDGVKNYVPTFWPLWLGKLQNVRRPLEEFKKSRV